VDAHGPARTSTVRGAVRRRGDGDAGASPLDRRPFDGTYTGIGALVPASAATGTAFDARPAPVRGAYRSTDAGSSPLDGAATGRPRHARVDFHAGGDWCASSGAGAAGASRACSRASRTRPLNVSAEPSFMPTRCTSTSSFSSLQPTRASQVHSSSANFFA